MLASLPAALLWAASFATSTDSTKGPLCSIEARQTDLGVRLTAVDGIRCFRCIFPSSERFYAPERPLRLKPKAFSKTPSRKAIVAALHEGGVVEFQDHHSIPSGTNAWQADPLALAGDFPNVDQVWPDDDSLSCKPGEFIAMNASFVGDFMKVAAKLGHHDHFRFRSTDRSVAPVVLEALLDNAWLGEDPQGKESIHGEVWLQYLLMPVQVRR